MVGRSIEKQEAGNIDALSGEAHGEEIQLDIDQVLEDHRQFSRMHGLKYKCKGYIRRLKHLDFTMRWLFPLTYCIFLF